MYLVVFQKGVLKSLHYLLFQTFLHNKFILRVKSITGYEPSSAPGLK